MAAHAAPPVTLDRCPTCQGLWFDSGELRDHLAERLGRPGLKLSLGQGGRPSELRCPKCAGRHLTARSIHGVVLDVCSGCDGVLVRHDQVPGLTARAGARPSLLDSPVWSVVEVIGQVLAEIGAP
jgi:Zn-finger nucleic acid-binding protein